LPALFLILYCQAASAAAPEGMAAIPGGPFLMGSPQGQGRADEHPLHKVNLKTFYIDKTEVTVGDYRAYAGDKTPDQPSWSTDQHPVLGVSWKNAVAYCKSKGKRLPTEAEWEKAARGGNNKVYFFGDAQTKLDRYCWYNDNSGGTAHPVGKLGANQYGLYDMCGNAFEWTADIYDEDYYAKSPAFNPTGPENPLLPKSAASKKAGAQKTQVKKLKVGRLGKTSDEAGAKAAAAEPARPPKGEEEPTMGLSNENLMVENGESLDPSSIKQLNASFDGGGASIAESTVYPSARGGSWLAAPDMLRMASRSGDEQAGGGLDIGFRCAR
ncbi:MAG: formylglycine-generating enzyme family protein, partial [Elusimicrobia bacterium]|nr:formylglycine-generating enzyme family protein [Elusimicrobiota bacterium]